MEVLLHTADGSLWQGSCEYEIADNTCQLLPYRYGVRRDGKRIRQEFGAITHQLCLCKENEHHIYNITDNWRDLPVDSYRYSSAFSHAAISYQAEKTGSTPAAGIVVRALWPCMNDGQNHVPGITGSGNALGNWGNEAPPQPLHEVRPGIWQLMLDTRNLPRQTQYKFVLINRETGDIADWETGDNRTLPVPAGGETLVLPEAEPHFAGEQPVHVAGTAIPVFSLRSEGSFGVGDFGDLKTFIGWAADTGQRAVQILPINDTTMTGTWMDSYPYNSISIYAFHPMYADLRQLPPLADADEANRFEAERVRLNALPSLEYEEVNRWKRAYLKAVYRQERERIKASDGYCDFLRDNREWLRPYAAFRCLTHRFGTADFHQWQEYTTYSEEAVARLGEASPEAADEMGCYCFVQYVLHVQLLAACDYGRQRGVVVKGDIPIGISRTSVEAWREPHYFNLNGQAGAPPDAFATNGQNWGMPTYNWQAMEADNYRWWRQRFEKMARYFTAYRIDHILGFFRIWEIPLHAVHGLLGHFSPALPLTPGEIEAFGLPFRPKQMTRPCIDDELLAQLFGPLTQQVKDEYLLPLGDGRYALRPETDTQRKVEARLGWRADEEAQRLREGLYALIADVLFLEDEARPGTYHPRIAAQGSHAYRTLLDEAGRRAFDRLYEHFYYERHNDFWYAEAMKKLPALTQATPMLACGEDLGMVPACVPWVMEQLQVLSLEVERMPKAFGRAFGQVKHYPRLSVCTIGTHDMSPRRGGWQEDAALTARYWRETLGHDGEPPQGDPPGRVCREVVERHLQSPSMLCILAWQDWLAMDDALRAPDPAAERINIPAQPRHYWRWRMHLTIEQLRQATGLNGEIRRLIRESGR